MKIRTHIYGFVALSILMFLSGCTEGESFIDSIVGDDPDIIHIGGIENTTVETSLGGFTTRAAGDNAPVDAETVEWLLGPLFGGLDITYGAQNKPETKAVAILKLQKKVEGDDISASNIKYSQYSNDTEKIAEYSFKYLGTDTDAKWYDNGEHFFQGVFVPEKLRFNSDATPSQTAATVNDPTSGKAPNLKYDQSKDGNDDNYTLLARYLGMPADAMLHATVGRIKLPFRHRLARVKAYVLIDPTMGNAVTINGYKKDAEGNDVATEDATTSDIRFCNVDVLSAVEESASSTTSGHTELTPRWDKARKVIPHFVEECGSKNSLDEVTNADFLMFYNTELKTYIFPSDDEDWAEAKKAWDDAYTEALKGGTSAEEMRKAADTADKNSGYKRTNYGKVPVYDLIVRPTYKSEDMVMYDEDLTETTIADLVELHNNIDFEITLNNGLEYFKSFPFNLDANFQNYVYLRINRESIDYNSSGAETWTEVSNDDGYYGVNNQNGNTLSFAGSSWQRAYRIGSKTTNVTDGHWYGKDDTTDDDNVQDDDAMPWYPQYVSQTQWVNMFAEAYMDPVTGTKGLHHGDYFILDNDITIDAKALPADFVFTGHLDGQDHTITLTGMGEKVVDEAAWDEPLPETLYRYVDAVLYTQAEIDAAKAIVNADGYVTGTNPEADATATKTTDDVKVAAHYEPFTPTSWSQIEGMTLYSDDQGTLYVAPDPIHHPEVSHTSGSTLFAGLNGAYAAAIGEANVHSENGILVPYVDATTGTGWRAEVINTIISGADMFPAEVIVDGNYNVNKVSGYIYNCWKGSEKIKSHTPTLPKYK